MSDIKKWKTPAASNVGSGFTPPDGFPEGMLRSDLNNSMREVQASMRRLWDTPDWKDPVDGFTVVQGADSTKVKIQATDATGYFLVNQKVRVRASSSASAYAFVASVAMVGSDTEVTLEDFDTTGTPTPSTSVPASCNGIDIYFLGGGDMNNHGIGRSAFSSGQSVGFEIPASNDAAGINAAIVAASSNGKTVLLPNTVVTLDASLVITSSTDNVRIVGMGGGAVKSQLQMGSGLNLPVFDIRDGSSRITLENFYINGDCTNQTTGGDGIRFGDNVQNVRIRDLWIVNCWGNGISFSGTDTGGGEHYAYIWIESTDIHRCGNTGIYITDPNGTNDRIFISDVAISQFGDTGDAATSGAQACGIDLAGRAQIEGVVVWPTTLSPHASFAGAAIRLHESGGSGSPPGGRQCQVSNFRIAGNMVGVTGLHLRGADCQVSNGFIDLSGTGTVKPISVEGAGSGLAAASDTIISNVNVADGTRSEILGTTERVLIESCHFTAASETGLLVGGDYTKVLNCSFDGGTAGYTIAKGIEVQSGADGVEIKGCIVRGCTGVGITLTGDTAAVTDCTIETITGDAIVVNGDNNLIQGNAFRNLSAAGITINVAANVSRIIGNSFYAVTSQHVVDASTDSIVASNNSPTLTFNGQVASSSGAQTIDTGVDGENFFSIAHPQAELGSARPHSVTVSFNAIGAHSTIVSFYTLRLFVGTAGTTGDEEVYESAINILIGDSADGSKYFQHTISYTPSVAITGATKLTGTLAYGTHSFQLNNYLVSDAYRTQDIGQ